MGVEGVVAIIALPIAIGLAILVTSMALVVIRAKRMVPGTTLPAAIRVAWMLSLAIITALWMSRETRDRPRHRV